MRIKSKVWSLFRRFSKSGDGVAAVEFGLVVPLFTFSFLAMIDVAMSINGRMHLDSAMRSAAESTLTDPGVVVVKKVFDSAKTTSADGEDEDAPDDNDSKFSKLDFTLDVNRYCACPNQPDVSYSCNSVCTASEVPYLFYHLNGSAVYSGIFLSNISLKRTIKVQLR